MNNSGQRSAGNKTVTTRFAIAVIPTRQATAQAGKQDQKVIPTVSVSAQEIEQIVVRSTPALDKDCELGSEEVRKIEEAGAAEKVDENLLLNAYHTMLGAFFQRFSYHRALGSTGAATIDAITLIEAYDRACFPQQPTPEQNKRLQLFNHWALATQPMRSRLEFKVASDKQSVSSATENFCAASLKACIAASRYLSNDWNTVSVRAPHAINLEFLNLLNSYILMFVAAHVAFVDIVREPACTAHLERLLSRNNANLEQLQGLLNIVLRPCFRVAADGQELVSELQNEFYLRLAAATDSALMISEMHLNQVQFALKSTDFTTAATIAALSAIQELLVLTHQDYTSLDRAIVGSKEAYRSVAKPPEKVPHNKHQKRKPLNPNNRSAQSGSTSSSSAAITKQTSELPSTTATATEATQKQPAAASKKTEPESTAQTASTSTSSAAISEQTRELPSTTATTSESAQKQPAASKKAEPPPKQVDVKKTHNKQTKKPQQKAPAVAATNIDKKANASSPGTKSVSLRPPVQTIDSKELGSFTTVQTKKDRRQQAASSVADMTAEPATAQRAAQISAVADSRVLPTSSAVAGEKQRAAEILQRPTAVATRSKATSSQTLVTGALAQSSSVQQRAAQPVKPTAHTASTSQPASNAATENYWHRRAAESARLNAASVTATTSEAVSTQSSASNVVAQTSEQRQAVEVAPVAIARSPAAASTSETTNTQPPTTNGVAQTSAQQQTAATDKNDVTVTTKTLEPLKGRGRRHSFSTLFAETEKVTGKYVKNTFIHIPTVWR